MKLKLTGTVLALCLFVAVGMDAGARKSAVFTALTRPVADLERDQAAAALPGIIESATLRRIADQAAAVAEAAAGKAPASQQEEARAIAEREQTRKLKLHGAHFSISEGILYMLDETEGEFRPA